MLILVGIAIILRPIIFLKNVISTWNGFVWILEIIIAERTGAIVSLGGQFTFSFGSIAKSYPLMEIPPSAPICQLGLFLSLL
jgi:hypothetical protein